MNISSVRQTGAERKGINLNLLYRKSKKKNEFPDIFKIKI